MASSTIRNLRPPGSTVVRAATLLQHFTPEHPRLGLSALQTLSGFSRTTTYRYLSDLVTAGLLSHTPDGYALSTGALHWGRTVDPWHHIRDRAMPTLVALHRHTGLTVNLALIHEHDVILVEKVTPARKAIPHTHVGNPVLAHSTALGKVILSLLPTDQREGVLEHSLRQRSSDRGFTIHRLERELAEARQQRFARETDEARKGYWCAAAPVCLRDGQIAAISLAASNDRPPNVTVETKLRQAARILQGSLA